MAEYIGRWQRDRLNQVGGPPGNGEGSVRIGKYGLTGDSESNAGLSQSGPPVFENIRTVTNSIAGDPPPSPEGPAGRKGTEALPLGGSDRLEFRLQAD